MLKKYTYAAEGKLFKILRLRAGTDNYIVIGYCRFETDAKLLVESLLRNAG